MGKLDAFHRAFPHVALVNMYGITETCVHVTYKAIDAADIAAGISNVGRPIPTTVAYILDAQQRLLPIGVAGEVKIRGFRIELGEIEAKLLACEGVREARVLARDDAAQGKRLIAYLIPQSATRLDVAAFT